MADRETLLKILDLARWAPSGDNTQPWRFRIVADDRVEVRGFDTRAHVLYDFEGRASQMAHGALLETLRIAATGFGLAAQWRLRAGEPEGGPIYDVTLTPDRSVARDPLFSHIEQRVVQRRPMSASPLTEAQRRVLAAAAGPGYRLRFLESAGERWRVARLLWDNAGIRLTCPEAFAVHREIIEWGARFSKDRIPERAVGVDPLTGRLMKWVMQRWERVDFFNRYLLGTVPPRIQLDFLPGLGCAAHMLLIPEVTPTGLLDYVRAGVALQRLWLSASSVGLHLQPQMTPVIFRWYEQAGRRFSAVPEFEVRARSLARAFEELVGAAGDTPFVFFCRVGRCSAPTSRSLRKDLSELLVA